MTSAPHFSRRRENVFWTDADEAELAVLTNAFVDGVWEHREKCSVCSVGWGRPGWDWCEHVAGALDEILDWQRARVLLNRARTLRLQQELVELRERIDELDRERRATQARAAA
jgi:hypothetical protein